MNVKNLYMIYDLENETMKGVYANNLYNLLDIANIKHQLNDFELYENIYDLERDFSVFINGFEIWLKAKEITFENSLDLFKWLVNNNENFENEKINDRDFSELIDIELDKIMEEINNKGYSVRNKTMIKVLER